MKLQRRSLCQATDSVFGLLMLFQWWQPPVGLFGTHGLAKRQLCISPSRLRLSGGPISGVPVLLTVKYSEAAITRRVVAVSQMLFSALLMHLTGGRIETHFHVFGSLVFLAFYRDWRVLLTAPLVISADRFFRSVYWPESVF